MTQTIVTGVGLIDKILPQWNDEDMDDDVIVHNPDQPTDTTIEKTVPSSTEKPIPGKSPNGWAFWRNLNKQQKASLVTILSLVLVLPIAIGAVLNPRAPGRSRANPLTPITPPETPTPTPAQNQAASFGSGYVDADYSHSITNLTTATLEAWVRPSQFSSNLVGSVIISKKRIAPSESIPYDLHITDNGNLEIYLSRFNGTSWGVTGFTSDGQLTLNEWQHVAVTIDSSDKVRFFINGVMSGEFDAEGSQLGYPGNEIVSRNVRIGETAVAANSGQFYGEIDDVRISNIVMYPNAQTIPPTQPLTANSATLLLYNFDGDFIDSSGNDHNGNVWGQVGFVLSDIFGGSPTPTSGPTFTPTSIPTPTNAPSPTTTNIPTPTSGPTTTPTSGPTITPTPTPPPSANVTPRFLTNRLKAGTVGSSYKTVIYAMDEDGGDNLTMTINSLPPVLFFGGCTNPTILNRNILRCEITGTPAVSGKFNVVFTLDDGTESVQRTMTLGVREPGWWWKWIRN